METPQKTRENLFKYPAPPAHRATGAPSKRSGRVRVYYIAIVGEVGIKESIIQCVI